MAIAPRGVVVKTTRCPYRSKAGLLSAVDPISNVDPHWMASGIEWEDFLCSPGVTGFIDECPPASGFVKPADRSTQFCPADPFVIVGSYQCPPVGRPADEAFEIARQRLLAWEEWQLERTLWSGIIANGSGFVNPSFAFGNPDCDILPINLTPDGAVSTIAAISLLEEALGNTVSCGIIHAPNSIASYFRADEIIQETGAYFTTTDLRIIFGAGYPGTGPGNSAPDAGETWIFGTGPLVMTSSDMLQVPSNIQEGMNRMINDVEVRAERFYSIGFSCALFAVNVDLCDEICP